jgi:preprotein translocase subunit YajC
MGSLIFLIPILLIAWLFLTQRKRQQQMRSAQQQIEVGEEVSTTSGMLGTLVELDDDEGTIEVSPGVRVRFVRRAIVPRGQVGGQAAAESSTDEPTDGATESESTEPVDLSKSAAAEDTRHDPETKAE